MLTATGCGAATASDTGDAECVVAPVHDTSITPEDSDLYCHSQGNPNYFVTTCPDGRVEMDCQGYTWVVDYCFSADGRLLGAVDPCGFEGEPCDCNGDGWPTSLEELCARDFACDEGDPTF